MAAIKQRPTTLAFGVSKATGFSPMSTTTPRSRVGTPLFHTEGGKPQTPGIKRLALDSDLRLLTELDPFGPAPSKMLTLDDDATAKFHLKAPKHTEDEWGEATAPVCVLNMFSNVPESMDMDAAMECSSAAQTPGTPFGTDRPFGYKTGVRRLARTPATPIWESEVFVLPEGVTSPFVTHKPFPSEDLWE